MQHLKLFALALAVLVASTAAASAEQQPPQQAPTLWNRLGPPGPKLVRVIAAGPDWPRQGPLLVARSLSATQDQLERTIGPDWDRPHPSLELSTRFASDGVGLLTMTKPVEEHYECMVRRSGDGGSTWNESLPAQNAACGELRFSYSSGQLQILLELGGGWRLSSDNGVTWPAELGPGAARLPRVEAERPVRVRQLELNSSHGLWIGDDRADWFDLFGLDGTERFSYYRLHPKSQSGWATANEQVFEGVTQHFDGGSMVWLPYADGRRVILVLANAGAGEQWREYTDPLAPPSATACCSEERLVGRTSSA